MPWLVEACRDPEIPRWTRIAEDYGPDHAAIFGQIADREQAEGRGLHLIVVDVGDDERRLGSVAVVDLEPAEARCELGYWVAREARGAGVATRAVRLLSAWVLANLEIARIAIHVEPANAASLAVAERAGFRREGVLRSYFVNKGRRRDAVVYSLLREEAPPPG